MVEFYQKLGPSIFSQRLKPSGFLGDIVDILSKIPGISTAVGDLDLLFIAKWSNAQLHSALVGFFGDTKLADLGRKVVLPTLAVNADVPNSSKTFTVPTVMDNFPNSSYCDVLARDAMMRSGAAPTYFESYQGFVDGGLVANNPSVVALAAALDPSRGAQALDSVRILSVGTGLSPEGITAKQPLDWGIVKWGPIVYDVSSTSVNEIDSYQAQQILGPRYCRLNLVLDKSIALDDGAAIPTLIALADKMRSGKDPGYEQAKKFVQANFG
jgi:hypothetical protein